MNPLHGLNPETGTEALSVTHLLQSHWRRSSLSFGPSVQKGPAVAREGLQEAPFEKASKSAAWSMCTTIPAVAATAPQPFMHPQATRP